MNGFVSMSSGISLGLSSKPISSLSSRCVPIPRIGRGFVPPQTLSKRLSQHSVRIPRPRWQRRSLVTRPREGGSDLGKLLESGAGKGCKGQEAGDKSLP